MAISFYLHDEVEHVLYKNMIYIDKIMNDPNV